nr:ERI1 exoribonuclease 2 isoform X2 [Cavia porcellus]
MIKDGCLMKITKSLNKVPKKNPNILARNLNINQAEETSACTFSIESVKTYDRESKNSVSAEEKVQVNSVCMNSLIKVQQHQLLPESNIKADLHSMKSCSSVFNTKPSTPEQFQSHSMNSPIYVQKKRKNEHLAFNTKSKSSPSGSELVLVSTTIPSVNHVSDMEMSSTVDCLPMLDDWEDMVLLPASQPEQNTDRIPPISGTDLDISFNSGERWMSLKESKMPSTENLEGIKETPQKNETCKSFVYKSPHTTVYNVKQAKDPGLNASTFKLPDCKSHTFNSVNANASHYSALGKQPLLGGTKRNSSNLPAFPPAKKQTFIIYEEKPTSLDCSLISSSYKVSPSILTTTVNLQEPWKSGKMTPPLCKCGRRSKRLVVSNNGPNHGKVFYCCPIGKYQENRKPCDYFKWEQTFQKEKINSIVLSHSTGGVAFSSPKTSHIHDKNLRFSTKYSLRLRPSMRN